jgi:hypothetical protein
LRQQVAGSHSGPCIGVLGGLQEDPSRCRASLLEVPLDLAPDHGGLVTEELGQSRKVQLCRAGA